MQIGYGTKSDTPHSCIQSAINTGYSFIDGKDTNKAWNNIKRLTFDRNNTMFCSKLMGENKPDNHLPSNVRKQCLDSLKRAGLTYWDVYYIHTTYSFADVSILETWKELIKLKEDGHVKYIGLSNVTLDQLKTLVLNSKTPDYVQNEIHPYLTENSILSFCLKHNIKLVAHSPFGSIQNKKLIKDPLLHNLSLKYKKTPYQIILKWHIQRGIIPIPSSKNSDNILSNTQLNFEIQSEDILRITGLNKNKRGYIKPNHDEHRFTKHKSYRQRLIILDDLCNNPVINDIVRKGYHVCNIKDTNEELYQACKNISKHLEIQQNQHWKTIWSRSFMKQFEDKTTNAYKQLIQKNNYLNQIAQEYLQSKHQIRIFITKNTITNDLLPHQTGLFHRDIQKQKTLKIMIYLNDVDEWNGPLKVVSEDNNRQRWFREKGYETIPRTTENELINSDCKIETITGKQYTTVFFEGTLTHSGGYIQRGTRYAIYIEILKN